MKNLFKIISVTLSLFLSFNSILVFASTTDTYENQTSKIQDKEALNLFKILNKDVKVLKNINENPILKEDFKELNLLHIENEKDINIIYNKEHEDFTSVIAYNQNTNSNILLEANNLNGDVVIVINDEEYRLTKENEDIIAYSNNGNRIPILITEYQNDIKEIALPNKIALDSRTRFGKNYGPFYKTNKVLVSVLETIGVIGSVIKIKHPVLNTVCVAASVISFIADYAYATLYIKYYQAHAINDPTYVRQTEHYYNYNNYTSLVKTRIWHFYSRRPDW